VSSWPPKNSTPSGVPHISFLQVMTRFSRASNATALMLGLTA